MRASWLQDFDIFRVQDFMDFLEEHIKEIIFVKVLLRTCSGIFCVSPVYVTQLKYTNLTTNIPVVHDESSV